MLTYYCSLLYIILYGLYIPFYTLCGAPTTIVAIQEKNTTTTYYDIEQESQFPYISILVQQLAESIIKKLSPESQGIEIYPSSYIHFLEENCPILKKTSSDGLPMILVYAEAPIHIRYTDLIDNSYIIAPPGEVYAKGSSTFTYIDSNCQTKIVLNIVLPILDLSVTGMNIDKNLSTDQLHSLGISTELPVSISIELIKNSIYQTRCLTQKYSKDSVESIDNNKVDKFFSSNILKPHHTKYTHAGKTMDSIIYKVPILIYNPVDESYSHTLKITICCVQHCNIKNNLDSDRRLTYNVAHNLFQQIVKLVESIKGDHKYIIVEFENNLFLMPTKSTSS